jgi:hypothetical protein
VLARHSRSSRQKLSRCGREQLACDDRLVVANPEIMVFSEQPQVHGIPQRRDDLSRSPRIATTLCPGPSTGVLLGAPAIDVSAVGYFRRCLPGGSLLEHPLHRRRLADVRNELLRPRVGIVAERHGAGDPHSPSFQAGTGFGDSPRDHLALKFGEGRENVQHEAVLRAVPKFRSGDNDQSDAVFPEIMQKAGAPEQAARKPVQPMDDKPIHLAVSDKS